MIRICAIHGIGNSPASRDSLAARWTAYLCEAGIDALVDVAEWDSSGSPARDITSIVTRPAWVREQIENVRAVVDRMKPDMIIAHSFGAVIASHVAGERLTMAIGSPIGHPVYGSLLRARGIPKRARPSYDVYNRDDDVACSRLFGRRDAVDLGWYPVRVAVAGRGAFALEHRDDLYLTHPTVHTILRFWGARSWPR